jgi:lysophospholipase L1-like esterase
MAIGKTMIRKTLLLPLVLFIPVLLLAQLPPVRIILVGDSTVAPVNGWGPGFCDLLTPEATCLNLAKNGRSSGSFRAEGLWDKVIESVRGDVPADKTWVLIQFGHNDQPGKPGRSTDVATEFPANMRSYAEEIKAAGAHPVLITPLTRRSFKGGHVTNDLEAWAAATRKVARDLGVPVLELNAESLVAVQKMGPAEANTLAMAPPPPVVAESAASGNSLPAPKTPAVEGGAVFDYTHLGPKGSAFFGQMVAGELAREVPALLHYFKR